MNMQEFVNNSLASTSALYDGHLRRHTYLRVSVTDRCNLRCTYCMPQTGVKWRERDEILTLEELSRVIACMATAGITKVRFTGGEPLVRKDLAWLIAKVSQFPNIEKVAMTTNGILLQDHLQQLVEAGLSAVNISLDTLQSERFEKITRFDKLSDTLAGINAALRYENLTVKINMVVTADVNDDELCDFIEYFCDTPVELRFIEYMPFRGTQWQPASLLPFSEILLRVSEKYLLIADPNKSIHATAKQYRIPGKQLK
ncbi:MAG: radical SAM protein, partial [bacterium]|nr:radical SAM protein [bacterium]